MYLNVLGVSRDSKNALVPFRPWADDVTAEDLGGTSVDISALSDDDVLLLTGFLRMADKGAAHLTLPMEHPLADTHDAVRRIIEMLKVHLYDATGRRFPVVL